jgi:hypothetical protein
MSTTPYAAINIRNILQWGKLVKTWATGVSYFRNDTPSIPIERLPVPRSLEELLAQAELVGAGLTITPSGGIRGLSVVQFSADTFVLRLPPKERIEAMEQALRGGGRYPFRDYVANFIGRDLTEAESLEAHACRVGDYTISYCG